MLLFVGGLSDSSGAFFPASEFLVLAAACHKVSEDRKHESKTGIGYRDD